MEDQMRKYAVECEGYGDKFWTMLGTKEAAEHRALILEYSLGYCAIVHWFDVD